MRLSEKQATGLSKFSTTYNESGFSDSPNEFILTNSDNGEALIQTASAIISGKYSFEGILDLAETDSDVKVLSTPSIVVSHNEEGVINVSESRPIVTGSTSSITSGSTTSLRDTVEYRDIGIELKVTPLIGADGSVQMEIKQSANQLSTSTAIVNQNPQPIIGKREANSTITVSDKEIAILAGLQQNEVSDSVKYFPFMSRLPILKNILSGTKKNFNRTELIIFIRPTIIRNPNQSHNLSKNILEKYEEGKTIENYLKDGTIRDIYMEGSRLSPKVTNQRTVQINNATEAINFFCNKNY